MEVNSHEHEWTGLYIDLITRGSEIASLWCHKCGRVRVVTRNSSSKKIHCGYEFEVGSREPMRMKVD